MPKPNEYIHILRWGKRLGSMPYYIADQQQLAADTNAPLNAIYQKVDGTWATWTPEMEEQTR